MRKIIVKRHLAISKAHPTKEQVAEKFNYLRLIFQQTNEHKK